MNIAAFSEKSLFQPRLLAEEWLTTQDEIAHTVGLSLIHI